MPRVLRSLLIVCALLCGGLAGAQELQAVPTLTARVTDLTGTLSEDQRGALEAKLAGFEQSKGTQIAVLLVPTVKPESIEEYSMRVVEAWKLGRKGVDDGALLIVAKQDRRLRIEVGYGLEGALSDATSSRIINEIITPRFKQSDFFGGIEAGVDKMIAVVSGEPLPEPAAQSEEDFWNEYWNTLFLVSIVALFAGRIMRSIFGRLPGAAITGIMAGGLVYVPIANYAIAGMTAAVVAFVAFLVTLLGRQDNGSWTSSGYWSRNSSGRFSSFSGGGGGFGGGGASGSW